MTAEQRERFGIHRRGAVVESDENGLRREPAGKAPHPPNVIVGRDGLVAEIFEQKQLTGERAGMDVLISP